MREQERAVRVYDTFLFDGELDLLEHRLRRNYDEIHAFVLVEAAETYRGVAKSLVYEQHQDRFQWAAEKIRHISLPRLGPAETTARARAEVQRNAVLLGLYDARAEDVVLLLDADEIPSRALIQRLKREGLATPHRLAMTRHYQSLDTLAPASTCCVDRSLPFAFARGHVRVPGWAELDARWSGRSGVAVPVRIFQQPSAPSPFRLRFFGGVQEALGEAGRHLTALDPSAQLPRKLHRMMHEEWATQRGAHPPHLLRCQRYGVHHRGWWYAEAPGGNLPEDIAELAERCPLLRRPEPLPAMWRRRLVRTWAWVRLWPKLPDQAVHWVDRHFRLAAPLLLLPLLLADTVRWVLAHRTPVVQGPPLAEEHAHD